MPPKFLYFDLGNVLLTFDNDRMARQIASVLNATEEAVRQKLFGGQPKTDLQWRFEEGLVTEEDYFAQVTSLAAAPVDRAQLEHAASDMFAPIQPTIDLAQKLAGRGYRLGLLSNTNAWHWRFIMQQYPVLREVFEIEITSFWAKSMKPDRQIYEQAIESSGVERQDIFFTDDKPENIAGAIEAGFDAVPFVSTKQLVQDLRVRGVEVD